MRQIGIRPYDHKPRVKPTSKQEIEEYENFIEKLLYRINNWSESLTDEQKKSLKIDLIGMIQKDI